MSVVDRLRFHLDESCDPRLAHGLRIRGVDATTSQEAGLLGRLDSEQIAFAHRESRVLVTHDDDFLKFQSQGVEHSGIIYCHQRRHSLGEIVRRLALVWESKEPQELKNRIHYL